MITLKSSPTINMCVAEKGIYRYHLYSNRYGVTAVYKCSKTGKLGGELVTVIILVNLYCPISID